MKYEFQKICFVRLRSTKSKLTYTWGRQKMTSRRKVEEEVNNYMTTLYNHNVASGSKTIQNWVTPFMDDHNTKFVCLHERFI